MFSHINPSTNEPFFPLSVLDYRAKNDPEVVWTRFPRSEDTYDNGFVDITYAEFQNAVDGVAYWLKTATGKPPGTTIAYIGLWDPRYVWFVLGACKAGYRMVFPSLLFTVKTLNSMLFDQLNCETVITADQTPPAPIGEFISCNNLQHLQCPSVSDFLTKKHPHFPYDKTYEEAADDVLAVMYTSGSTSDPKPIVWTNSFAASFLRQNVMPPPEGWESLDRTQQGVRLINILPVLHCGSLYSHLFTAPLTKTIGHYPLPGSPQGPETFLNLIEHLEVDTVIMPPPYAEYIAADPARVAKVASKISNLAYAGGPLSTFAGETLGGALNVFSLFACTENGVYPCLRPAGPWDPDRWRTIHFHPDGGFKFEAVGDGTYELVIPRPCSTQTPSTSSNHDPNLPPALKTFPDRAEWRTEDVFAPDPTEPGSWIYSRRISDMLRYTDNSTFNPLDYEQRVRSDPSVAAALLYAHPVHPNAAVMLLEPVAALRDQEPQDVIELVWPCISEANARTGGRCVVDKSCVVVTRPGKEIPRATKGTTQRGKARLLYEAELAAAGVADV